LLYLFFFQISVLKSRETVPNGHIVADAMRQTDADTNVFLATPNRISSPLASPLQETETNTVTNDREVIPVIITDTSDTDSVRQNGELTTENNDSLISQNRSEIIDMTGHEEVVPVVVRKTPDAVQPTSTSRSLYKKKGDKSAGSSREVINDVARSPQNGDIANRERSSRSVYQKKNERSNENRRQEVVPPVVIKDPPKVDVLWRNSEPASETKKPSTFATKQREQETQIKSLHIEDDGDADDDSDVVEERLKPLTVRNSSEGQASGAEMFASNRPHAWHQELSKKRHETASVEAPLDRQVFLIAFVHQTFL